jgi:hypothetical protein
MPQCEISTCSSRASYNVLGEKAIRCAKHKTSDMVDVVHALCQEPNCTKQAICGMPGTKKKLYCKAHAKEGTIDFLHKTCEKCDKRPIFNYEGKKMARFCFEHKLDKMIDVVNNLCIIQNCGIRASFNYQGLKKGLYCAKHQLEDMINVVDKKP